MYTLLLSTAFNEHAQCYEHLNKNGICIHVRAFRGRCGDSFQKYRRRLDLQKINHHN
jgi:hypothetical protein